MTRRVTTTRRSAARDMTKALLHAGVDLPVGRHRSLGPAAKAPAARREAPRRRARVRPTMPKM